MWSNKYYKISGIYYVYLWVNRDLRLQPQSFQGHQVYDKILLRASKCSYLKNEILKNKNIKKALDFKIIYRLIQGICDPFRISCAIQYSRLRFKHKSSIDFRIKTESKQIAYPVKQTVDHRNQKGQPKMNFERCVPDIWSF